MSENESSMVQILSSPEHYNHLADVYDAAGAQYFRLAAGPRQELTGKGITVGIVDTGLLADHPDIRPRLIDAVDFTGEGVEDENGHGTKVGLLLLQQAPDALVISVKALGRNGEAAESTLIKALKWVAQDERIDNVNLSAGIYKPNCEGHCALCEAARDVSRAKIISVAAGNVPGIIACPAKASDAVIPVTEVDSSGKLAPGASPAGACGFAWKRLERPPDGEWVGKTI